jgi:hypothetical protein
MRQLGSTPLPPDHRLEVDAALDQAFAPLRARTTTIGPARVRAAVRWSPAEPRGLRGAALLARVSQLTVAAAISAFVFTGSVASLVADPSVPDISRGAALTEARALNGRLAFQPSIAPHEASVRAAVEDEFAANAATARRPEAIAPTHTVRDSEPFDHTP